jgi:hypothetical protein
VQEMLPGGVQLLGFLDSPLWTFIQPFDASVMPLANQTQMLLPLVNATGRLGPLCAAAYPNEAEQWKCLYGKRFIFACMLQHAC